MDFEHSSEKNMCCNLKVCLFVSNPGKSFLSVMLLINFQQEKVDLNEIFVLNFEELVGLFLWNKWKIQKYIKTSPFQIIQMIITRILQIITNNFHLYTTDSSIIFCTKKLGQAQMITPAGLGPDDEPHRVRPKKQ